MASGVRHIGRLFAVRHGETAWSASGRHTGVTDIPLTARGRGLAERLRPILGDQRFALVLTSPLVRARETCELAGLGGQAQADTDLTEWHYGTYEGLTAAEIRAANPGWVVFRDGCPGGESPSEVGARADRVIARARAVEGDVVVFAHGHLLRVLVARWIGMEPSAGQYFLLDTGTVGVLGYYRDAPAIKIWNAPLIEAFDAGRSRGDLR
jgi:probable phosphoglycerate mutase